MYVTPTSLPGSYKTIVQWVASPRAQAQATGDEPSSPGVESRRRCCSSLPTPPPASRHHRAADAAAHSFSAAVHLAVSIGSFFFFFKGRAAEINVDVTAAVAVIRYHSLMEEWGRVLGPQYRSITPSCSEKKSRQDTSRTHMLSHVLIFWPVCPSVFIKAHVAAAQRHSIPPEDRRSLVCVLKIGGKEFSLTQSCTHEWFTLCFTNQYW